MNPASSGRKHAAVRQMIGGHINTAVTIIQGLMLVPLYLHYIGAHTYGLWLASGGILSAMGFIDLGSGVFGQRISKSYGADDWHGVGEYFTNGMVIAVVMVAMFFSLGEAISVWLPGILRAGEQSELLKGCFQLAVVAACLTILNDFLRAFAQALLRPVFVMASLIACRVTGIVTVVVLLTNDAGLWAIPLGVIVTETLVFVLNAIYAFYLFRLFGIRGKFDASVLKEYVRLSPSLTAAKLGNSMIKEIEPLLISIFIRPEVATFYVLTKRAADIIGNLLNVVISSSSPSFSHLVGEDKPEAVASAAKLIAAIVFSLGLIGYGGFVAMNVSFVTLWVGSNVLLDGYIVLFIAAGSFLRLLVNYEYRMLVGMGDFSWPSLAVLFEALLRIMLMYFFLMVLGVDGVPLAGLVSCAIFLILLSQRSNFKLSSRYEPRVLLRRGMALVAVFSSMLVYSQIKEVSDSWMMFVAESAVVSILLYTFVAYMNPSIHVLVRRLLVNKKGGAYVR